MIAGIQSALSGLQAFAKKIENNANNIANINTDGFVKDRVLLSAQSPQGVKATIEQVDPSRPLIAAAADQAEEMVGQSNVDLGDEIPDTMLNKIGYFTNLKTLQAADQMTQSVLDLKA